MKTPNRISLGWMLPVCCVALVAACRSAQSVAAPPPSPPTTHAPVPTPAPAPAPVAPIVRTAPEPVTLSAWVEPAHLPPGGGSVTIMVRVRRADGGPYPGVDVQVASSRGTLAAAGGILTTDAEGLATDRLETRRTAAVTVNAGGTVYRFPVPVLPAAADPNAR